MSQLVITLFIILVAIGMVILITNKLSFHPFIALVISSLFVGFATGISGQRTIELITSGFGDILSGIGIIVVLGTIMGVFVEKSGALNVIADRMIKLFGSRRLTTSISFLGAVVSIPVFCDAGFIILSRLVRRLAKMNRSSSIPLSLSLGAGLYTTHTLIPPTPGPIAVAGNLSISDQLGIVILTGILISIPVIIVSSLAAKKMGKGMQIKDFNDLGNADDEGESTNFSLLWALTPIVTPILLITTASISRLIQVNNAFIEVLLFLGNPNVALLLGCFISMIQVGKKVDKEGMGALFSKGINQAGPIVLITGAGGAFGSVLKGTDLSDLISGSLGDSFSSFPLLVIVAFMLAALLKTAQGSSTSALVIASAIVAPVIVDMGSITSFQSALLVMSFGGGAMTVSHANDSYFWVVTQFSGMTIKQGYRGFSLLTLIQGVATLLTVLALYFFSLLF